MDDVVLLSSKVIEAVEAVMNVNVEQQRRIEANEFLENFKESSPFCAQCGFHLASIQHPHVMRHIGLLFVEHCIKFRWNALDHSQKVFIKDSTMNLLAQGTENLVHERYHIKNALAKMVVEMIKREWPQQWPGLLCELYALSHIGATQTELVLLVLLRLAEDAVILQNIPTQRRREIYQSLTSNMAEIFDFLLSILEMNTEKYNSYKIDPNTHEQARQHCQVCLAALTTLVAYVDWVQVVHISSKDNKLLQLLCSLLCDGNLRQAASECLLTIVSRKGRIEDRKLLLILFSKGAMDSIFAAIGANADAPLNESSYTFLKRLCQILTGLGFQLCALWGSAEGVTCPLYIKTYLEAILQFTMHPSQVLNQYTFTLWTAFLRHEHASIDASFEEIIPRVVEVVSQKLIKVGYPSRSDSPSCAFARLDFDSDEDFSLFFSKYRVEATDLLRVTSSNSPIVTFNFAARWLRSQLERTSNQGGGDNGLSLCTLNSPCYLEWDALSVCLESVIKKKLTGDQPSPPVEEGLQLLTAVVNYQTEDPLILSVTLSCISALFVFLTASPDGLPAVLDKIFRAVVFSLPGQTKATRSRSVKNVRRHACSSLVKVCKLYPRLLLTRFDDLYRHICCLNSAPNQLSQMEKCTLTEALMLISNMFEDFGKQTLFIKEVLASISVVWLCQDVQTAFTRVEAFITYVGLDKPPVEPSNNDSCGINRSQVIFCSNMILAVMKRVRWPGEMDKAKKGGFVMESPTNNSVILLNPATEHILPLLPNVFHLLRVLNKLWLPASLQLFSLKYHKANDMLEVDKNNILGLPGPSVDAFDCPGMKQPLERMQHFLTMVHANSCHILGNGSIALGHVFFTLPNLVEFVVSSVLHGLDLVPDYRVRPVIRTFMKPFVQSCPPEFYDSVMMPVLEALCPMMYERLNKKWLVIVQNLDRSAGNDDDNHESQEVLEDQLHRQLTREHIDLLGAILQGKQNASGDSIEMMDEDDIVPVPQHDVKMGELGVKIFKAQTVYPSIVLCIFNALWWNDTIACTKSIPLCHLAAKQLISEQVLGSEEAGHLFTSVLMGLQRHGQHDSLQSLLINLGMLVYEAFLPHYPSVCIILSTIPGVTPQDVQSFNDKISTVVPNKQLSEKKKKEMFRILIADIIGKNVGQLFRKEQHFKVLPPLFRQSKPKPKPLPLDEVSSDIGLCGLFQPPTA